MFSDVTNYVKQKFDAAEINNDPYPHIQIDDIFPPDFYQQILSNKIDENFLSTLLELKRVGSAYPDTRKVLSLIPSMPFLPDSYRTFWEQAANWLLGDFQRIVLEKFEPYIIHRFGNIPQLHAETLYTYDRSTYALGPHTDSVKKVLTLLIYLPEDDSLSHLGTSMFVPNDSNFTCAGGPHHKFHQFKLLKTAQYKPNSLFGFFKTNNSFHGVEPIKENIRRDLLIYDVQVVKR